MDWRHDCSRVTFPYSTPVTASTAKSNWDIKACFCSPNLWKFHASAEMIFFFFFLSHFLCHGLLFPTSDSTWHEICLFSVPVCQNPSWAGVQILVGSSNKDFCRCQAVARLIAQQCREFVFSAQRRKTEAGWHQLPPAFISQLSRRPQMSWYLLWFLWWERAIH